jgi:diguanylate cyclase (GGDEF)-like protein/PAS domain S-box-containing protein
VQVTELELSLEMLERALDRERRARQSAEQILEQKSAELFEVNAQLSALADSLAQREKYAQEILNSVRDGIIVATESGVIELVNPSAEEILDRSGDDIIGRHVNEVLQLDKDRSLTRSIAAMLTPGSVIDAVALTAQGEPIHVRLAVGLAQTDAGVRHILGMHDLVREDRAVEVLRSQLLRDRLTGLPNAAGLQERFESVHVGPMCTHLAVIVIDLDRFSRVNDALGREAGDHVLIEVARRLTDHARSYTDSHADSCDYVLARMEGDEFAVLMRGERVRDHLDDEIRELLRVVEEPLYIGETRVDLEARVGYDLQTERGVDLPRVVDNAYLAIEHSRLHGGEAVTRYEQAIVAARTQVITVESDIRRGILAEEFEVFYQPQIEATSGLIRGAEALIRWHHPDKGLLYPGSFIPIAEQSSLIQELGKVVRKQALSAQIAAMDAGHFEPISINVSSHELAQEGFAQSVIEDVLASGVPKDLIQVELKETVVTTASLASHANVMALSEHFLIALDDFGTGLSSLARLRELPIGMLKVDRGFLRDLEEDSRGRALVAAVVGLSEALGTTLVVEGVETREQYVVLAGIGDALIQGYYFSPAVPMVEYLELLSTQPWRVRG